MDVAIVTGLALACAAIVIAAMAYSRAHPNPPLPTVFPAPTTPLREAVDRLEEHARLRLEAAAGRAHASRHESVTVEHWLAAIAESPGAKLADLWQYFEVVPTLVRAEQDKALGRLSSDRGGQLFLSPEVCRLLDLVWAHANGEFCAARAETCHVWYAVLCDAAMRSRLGPATAPPALTAAAVKARLLSFRDAA